MQRRDMIAATAVAAAGVVTAKIANAKEDHSHHHHAKHSSLLDITSSCIAKGEACITHCLDQLAKGDKDMGACAKSVREMLGSCNALLVLAAADSKHLKKVAALCIDVCESCAKECKKHAKTHATCKACMEACLDCVKACKKVA